MFSSAPAKLAFRLRRQLAIPSEAPVNVYDIAVKLGFEVRFVDLPSLEGMYAQGTPPTIVISSMRPVPRQVFTCAHEIAHHQLGHGEMVDGLVVEIRNEDKRLDDRERQADSFAAHLLMTPTAIDHACSKRSIRVEEADAKAMYEMASYFQVGYRTLVRHLQMALRKLSWARAEELVRRPLRRIRSDVLGFPCSSYLVMVSEFWYESVPADCQVDDFIWCPEGTKAEGSSLEVQRNVRPTVYRAASAGYATLFLPSNKKVTVRVSRKGYTGRLIYRWEEEALAVD